MDTTTPRGELLFSIFGALAQYERALTQERVCTGLAAAKRRGRRGGRPPEINAEKLDAVIAALNGGATKATVCRTFGAKRTTLIETLARAGWSGSGTAVIGKELEYPHRAHETGRQADDRSVARPRSRPGSRPGLRDGRDG